MSEGVRRLSLLLGILGACVGGMMALMLEPYTELQALLTYRERLQSYEHRFPQYEKDLAVWDSAKEHISTDGQRKFVKSDLLQTFGEALRWEKGDWYKWKEGEWVLTERASLYSSVTGLSFLEPTNMAERSDLGAPEQLEKPATPNVALFWLVIALPVLGFLIPWGTVRVVGWVIVGFVLDLRSKR